MSDIEQAKKLLAEDGNTCVLISGNTVYTSKAKGVSPILDLIQSKTCLQGFSCADKVVGKAVALLFVLTGVTDVYAEVLSEQAVAVFNKYKIRYSYGELTKRILNREGSGVCPMEEAVAETDNPQTALEAVNNKLKILRSKI